MPRRHTRAFWLRRNRWQARKVLRRPQNYGPALVDYAERFLERHGSEDAA